MKPGLPKPHERTRQRQGRDFPSVIGYLRNAEICVEGNYNMVGDGIINNVPPNDEEARRKSLLDRLEDAKGIAASHEAYPLEPVDGHEPPERGLY